MVLLLLTGRATIDTPPGAAGEATSSMTVVGDAVMCGGTHGETCVLLHSASQPRSSGCPAGAGLPGEE